MSDNGVRPKTQSEVRIWNDFSLPNRWDFIPINRWPADIAKNFITGNLGYSSIFRTFLYWVGNGMDPRKAAQILGMAVTNYKDAEHVKNLLKDYLAGKMYHYTFWDEVLGRTVSFDSRELIYENMAEKEYVAERHSWQKFKVDWERGGKTSGSARKYDLSEHEQRRAALRLFDLQEERRIQSQQVDLMEKGLEFEDARDHFGDDFNPFYFDAKYDSDLPWYGRSGI